MSLKWYLQSDVLTSFLAYASLQQLKKNNYALNHYVVTAAN